MDPLNPQSVVLKAKRGHTVLYIILGILALATIGLGVFVWNENKLNQKVAETKILTQIAVDPTITWKTYTNTKYGLSFQYPSDWKFNDTSGKLCGPQTATCLFVLEKDGSTQLKSDLDFHDGVTIRSAVAPALTKEIEDYVQYPKQYPGGKNFYVYGFTGSSEIESNYQVSVYKKLSNGSVIIFDWDRVGITTEDLSFDKYLDQILSTFKFTK